MSMKIYNLSPSTIIGSEGGWLGARTEDYPADAEYIRPTMETHECFAKMVPVTSDHLPYKYVISGKRLMRMPDLFTAGNFQSLYMSEHMRDFFETEASGCFHYVQQRFDIPATKRPANKYFFAQIMRRAHMIDWARTPVRIAPPPSLVVPNSPPIPELWKASSPRDILFKSEALDVGVWIEADFIDVKDSHGSIRRYAHYFYGILISGPIRAKLLEAFPDCVWPEEPDGLGRQYYNVAT